MKFQLLLCLVGLISLCDGLKSTAVKQKKNKKNATLTATRVPVNTTPATFLKVNLRSGIYSHVLPPGMSWVSRPRGGTRCRCDRQAVLKLTFSATRKRAEIQMTFEESRGFSFNIGDSITNDGYGGDRSTQKNDAEVHALEKQIRFYGKDRPRNGFSYGLLYKEDNFVAVNPYTTLTFSVSDELAVVDNGIKTLHIESYKLFALNGQPDSSRGGVNRDIYFSMNRVIRTPLRKGRGLCNVRVRFFPS